MTYGEALQAGYKDGETRWQHGYVSRRCDPMKQPVLIAGGTRKGELYVLLPSWKSTTYCIRQYLIK